MIKNPEIKTTNDGSHTLYSNRFDQHYHNPNGAVAESKHNFFETNGLFDALSISEQITILEVGFGTGLNLLLLMDALAEMRSPPNVNFYSIEAYPINSQTAAEFNFGQHLHHPELTDTLVKIFTHLEKGKNSFHLTEQLNAHIFHGFFEDFDPRNLAANFIFHDAFSPRVNPELWTKKTFGKLKKMSARDCILTTYSAASKAKGAMAAAGWNIAKAPGALGKREMTVASLNSNHLTDFKHVNQERLAKRYEEGDFDLRID